MIIKLKTPFIFLAAVFRAIWASLISKDDVIVSDDVYKDRLWECRLCRQYKEGQCKLCTCYVETKCLLRTEKCPIGRWRKL